MTLTNIDYWRLSDTLSVINAAMLAVGIDPGEKELVRFSNPIEGRFRVRGSDLGPDAYFESPKFIAIFSAMRNAILANSLAAVLAHRTRPATEDWFGGDSSTDFASEDEVHTTYDGLLRLGGGAMRTNLEPKLLEHTVFYLKEPDWNETTVSVDDLKAWMKRRGFLPPFFFPSEKVEGFRNSEHPRYSAKLACAVAAWENVKQARKNLSVKQTVEEWVRSNGVKYGLADKDGIIQDLPVQEIAKVVNWQTRGGAVPTVGRAEEVEANEPGEVENFNIIQQDHTAKKGAPNTS